VFVRELPAGTVTLLFTDIEGSTRLLGELGKEYVAVLDEHRRIVRESVEAHEGTEVDTQGDSFLIVFTRVSDAAEAASEIQDLSAAGRVLVRMGLHIGTPTVTPEGYVGLDVHHAARVMSAANGGQVLLSESARALLDGQWPVLDLGRHRLKDMGEPERLYQLGSAPFSPLRTLDSTNLPVLPNRLVGRTRELEELTRLFRSGERLVTLTGTGGSGKTRLALQAASELVGSFDDGVAWVALAGLDDSELVLSEISQAIGAADDLAGFVRDRELFLLLDNFEQVMPAAPAVSELLASAQRLRLLVTSRAPLRVAGERQVRLEPLDLGDAAMLFAERAEAAGGTVGVAEREQVDAICGRLDCLPLAIELAAARASLLGAARLLERLDAALPLLTSGSRDAPERHRALRATMEWSAQLLTDEERRLFSRLGVFAGSFSVEAAEDVCSAELDTLAALVDASLVKALGDGRFLLLETIREYALELLAAGSEEQMVRRRHAVHYAALAEQAYANHHAAESQWATALERDHDNLRAALEWLAENDRPVEKTLSSALGWFWLSHSHHEEGARRLAAVIADRDAEPAARARALVAAGGIAVRQGEVTTARQQLEEGIGLWRSLGDPRELASALDALGWMLFFGAQDDVEALRAFDESLAIGRTLGDRRIETRALVGVCQVLIAQGDVERSQELSQQLLAFARADADDRSEHFALHYLADCSLIRGDYIEAGLRYRESLAAVIRLGDVLETSFEVQGVAMSAAGRGDLVLSVTLAAAVEALWEQRGIDLSVPFWDGLREQHIGGARRALGPEADSLWEAGRKLSFNEAVQLALVSS